MKQATFTEVRNHAKQYFDIVEAGEPVTASLLPILFRYCSDSGRFTILETPKAQPIILDGVSVTKIILEEREGSYNKRYR